MGSDGEKAPSVIEKNPKLLQALENRSLLSSDPRVAELLTKYGTGGISLDEALETASGAWGTKAQGARPKLDPKAQEQWVEEQVAARSAKQKDSAWEAEYRKGTGRLGLNSSLSSPQLQREYQQEVQAFEDAKASYAKLGMSPEKTKEIMAQWGVVDPTARRAKIEQDSIAGLRSQLSNEYGQKLKDDDAKWTADTRGNYDQFVNLLTTSPLAAQRYATDELKNNSLTSGLFGDKGMQHEAEDLYTQTLGSAGKPADPNDPNSKETAPSGVLGNSKQYQDLLDEIKSGEAYKLNQDDHTAYGQLSGNIARMFGSQEQSLAQSLADRGLSAAPSGAAGAGFSGLQGNKMEQLAGAQRGVLQDRVKQANESFQLRNSALGNKGQLDLGTLNSASNTAGQLGSLGQSAISNLFNRNMEGRNQGERELANAADRQLANQQAVQNQINTQFNQEQSTKGPSFGDVALGLGGTVLGAAGGGFGLGMGGAAAGALGGALGLKDKGGGGGTYGTNWGEIPKDQKGLSLPSLGAGAFGRKYSNPEDLLK